MHHASTVNLYTTTAENEYVPYIYPQEHGNHSGVKRLDIGNISFVSDKPMDCNVSLYNSKQLTKAMHTDELIKTGKTFVRGDYKNSGHGSKSCCPALSDEFKLDEKVITFNFTLKLI